MLKVSFGVLSPLLPPDEPPLERDIFRAQLWSAFDEFIKKNAPAVSR